MDPHIFLGGAWQVGSGREPSGSTLLKRRQLGQLGYTAVAVPHWEWRALEGKVRCLTPWSLFSPGNEPVLVLQLSHQFH